MDIKKYKIDFGGEINVILGQSHFIKTVDDLTEIIVTTNPNALYAVAFNEASGEALIRYNSNDKDLEEKAIEILRNIKSGHTFVILLKKAYPINFLSKIKMCDEVCRIFCATANPLVVLTTEYEVDVATMGAGIIGVIDGISPKGVEEEKDKEKRRELLKKIGYKF